MRGRQERYVRVRERGKYRGDIKGDRGPDLNIKMPHFSWKEPSI